MARNTARRGALLDAGIAILAGEGSRGLTHRAVDQGSGVPIGTTSNYFRSRGALIQALVTRVGERLAPSAADLDRREARRRAGQGSTQRFAGDMHDVLARLLGDREATAALFELRLEGMRRPEVGRIIAAWRREAFRADLEAFEEAGYDGGGEVVALFHHAIEGLAFDRLTGALEPGASTDAAIDRLVAGLLSNGGERSGA